MVFTTSKQSKTTSKSTPSFTYYHHNPNYTFVGQALMTSFDEVMPIIRALPKNKNRQLIVPADYPKELNPIVLAPRFKRPTLLIVGEKDERTPVAMSKSILAMLPGEKEIWIVPKAEHGGANGPMQNFEVYNKKVLEFLNKYL